MLKRDGDVDPRLASLKAVLPVAIFVVTAALAVWFLPFFSVVDWSKTSSTAKTNTFFFIT
ncbi:MAG: hypothetical protein ACI4AK_08325 [Lepagella sp.]